MNAIFFYWHISKITCFKLKAYSERSQKSRKVKATAKRALNRDLFYFSVFRFKSFLLIISIGPSCERGTSVPIEISKHYLGMQATIIFLHTIDRIEKDVDWRNYPKFLAYRNPINAHKNVQKSSKTFKPSTPCTKMLPVQGRLSMCLLVVLGFQGIVVKNSIHLPPYDGLKAWCKPMPILGLTALHRSELGNNLFC